MPVTWLHISDFHIQGGDVYDRDVVLRTLVKSAKRFREKEGRGPDLVFVTGDIAFSGKPDEYELATQFFDELLLATQLGRTNLFVVPGNHDIDRRWGVQLSRTLNSRSEADDYFEPGVPKLHLIYKLGPFLNWYREYFNGIRTMPEDSTCGPVELVEVRGEKLGILPINSALFCQDDTDHNKLFVGRRCLDPALEQLKALDPTIRIALVHHPLEWLSSFERQNIRSSLIDNVDVILQGHLHEAGIVAVSMSTGRNLHCAAGAAYQTRQRPNTAFYATFDGRQVEVLPICYVDQPREVWTLDAGLFPDEPGHLMSFPVPRDQKFRSFRLPVLQNVGVAIPDIAAAGETSAKSRAKSKRKASPNERSCKGTPMRWHLVIVLLLASRFSLAQENAPAVPRETQLQSDFRREGEHIKESCAFSFKGFFNCAEELATDHPLHLALGSIAPQNGFGFGMAFVTHYTPNESWRISWDFDGVGATSASWRAGGYMKIIHTPIQHLTVVTNPTGKPAKSNLAVHPYTVFNVYAQAISLNQLFFFGLGPSTLESDKTVFGMQQTIAGANVIKPVTEWPAIRGLNLSLLGEFNGRFVNIRENHGESTPSIEHLYNNATAPGLASQPGFVQLGEGFRLKPTLFNDHLQFNYLVNFQQFFAPSDSTYSFRRWTVDLDHEIPLYGHSQSAAPKDTNGPDECAQVVGSQCPPVSYSRNRNGTVGLRLLISESIASAGSVVPFYFQPTSGGSDVNGNPALSSYQDYRFRAPNLMLLRESFEHSIWGPLGFTFMADQGKVALTRGDVDFQNLKHSFATGLTLRAGGFPQVFFLFAWGGNEGDHTIGTVNTSLLGGSARPSLF